MADDTTTQQPTDNAAPPQPIQPQNSDLTSNLPFQPAAPDQPQLQPQSSPDLATTIPTIPSETAPNNVDIERQYHESMWRRALDKVGSILGGDTTIHITKDADGNVTMSHDPSTTGEKWGRIASAALTGAAAGLANSQGPGGLARAAAAGIQTGTQLPQQREQQAQQQVDFSNKQLLATANRIHTTQQTFALAAEVKAANIKFDQDSADVINNYYKTLSSSPNSQDLGVIDPSDPNATSKAAAKNPAALDAYLGKGNQILRAVPAPDHKIHLVMTDKAWEDRRNDTEMEVPYIATDAKGNPILKSRTIPPQSDTNGNISTHTDSTLKQFYDFKKSNAAADKDISGPADKPLDTSGKTLDAWRQESDPNKKAQLWTQYQRQLQDEKTLRGRDTEGGPGGGGAAVDTPEEREQFLSTLNPGDAASVRAIGEVRNAPPSRYSKEGGRIMGLVNQAYPDYDSTNYPVYLRTKEDFSPAGTTGKGLNFIGTSLAHMDTMENHIDDLKNVNVPIAGSFINAVKNAALAGTSPGIKEFVTAQKAVTQEIARAYNGGAITQAERDHMNELISSSDSPQTIRASLQSFRELLHGKLDQYRIGWDSAMPHNQHNAVLDNLQARGTAYRPPAAPGQAPQPGGGGGPQATQQPGDAGRGTSQPPPLQGKPFDATIYRNVNSAKTPQQIQDAVDRARKNGMNVFNLPPGVK